ncbi:SpoIIE family protein phosphatase [Iodobacter fluviatilis]|uniref:Stage II sporulation protein E n=1 Tax=Iodobacter fluviatilis TaxID=537 RepID=A0A377Q8C6_9NEIS|nr:SpoIIE family protein phosphatase [Iodobacter fluviatilis]TCU81941.1 stage II sporulation protein E [Iodobacter fluviatilis]STQ91526.1 Stage II sporulation protein E (SpoIIE) [Iodobacter fluviatilis]
MHFEYARCLRPCYGEVVCGDGTFIKQMEHGVLVGILDVLGHGPEAHELARLCEQWLEENSSEDLEWMLKSLHEHIRGSRGTAITMAFLGDDGNAQCITIGNTVMRKLGKDCFTFPAQAGTLGIILRSIRIETFNFKSDDVFVLATDGIQEHIAADDILLERRNSLNQMVANLLSRFGKLYDDATCLAIKCTL